MAAHLRAEFSTDHTELLPVNITAAENGDAHSDGSVRPTSTGRFRLGGAAAFYPGRERRTWPLSAAENDLIEATAATVRESSDGLTVQAPIPM